MASRLSRVAAAKGWSFDLLPGAVPRLQQSGIIYGASLASSPQRSQFQRDDAHKEPFGLALE